MDKHSKGFAVLKGRQAFFERRQRDRENVRWIVFQEQN